MPFGTVRFGRTMPIMYKSAKLSLQLGFVIAFSLAAQAASAASASSVDDLILARLNALEKENAALRARVEHLEASQTTMRRQRAPSVGAPVAVIPPNAGFAADGGTVPPVRAVEFATQHARPHFEISGSLLFLQPSSGDFEQYAEVANPFPVPSPHWSDQAINPKYSPTFSLGLRYMPTPSDDLALDWTHLWTNDTASVAASASQFVGPPYSIGPPAGAAFTGGSATGSMQTQYDLVNLDAGHMFCVQCPFQFKVFGGVEFARVGQNLTGTFQDTATSTYHSYTSNSLFTGAGPRLGIRGQYDWSRLQFFAQAAGAGLIGVSQSGMNFATASPTLLALGITTNYQSLTSPDATAVVPSFDTKVGVDYNVPLSDEQLIMLELGYQAAIYFNAVTEFALSNVATSPLAGGVYLATEQQLHTNFTTQGPYLTASWLF